MKEVSQLATKKNAPLEAALQKVERLDEDERAARAHRDEARATLADLRSRNQSGDSTVTGMALMTAQAEVEAAEGLAVHAAKVLADARGKAAEAVAEYTAEKVRNDLEDYDLDRMVTEAREAATAALRGLSEALTGRDAASDAAGKELARAGVRPGVWTNGIRYVHVRNMPTFGAVIPGQFNVEVRKDDGTTAWLSSTDDVRDTRRVLTQAVEDVLVKATLGLPVTKRRPAGIV